MLKNQENEKVRFIVPRYPTTAVTVRIGEKTFKVQKKLTSRILKKRNIIFLVLREE